MAKKKHWIFIVIMMFLITSCATPMKPKLLSGEMPRFEGEIIPITTPIQPMYRPAKLTINISLMGIIGEGQIEMSDYWFQKITSFGESLLWETEINNMNVKVDGRHLDVFEKYLPIKTKMLSDKYGKPGEIEISLANKMPCFLLTSFPIFHINIILIGYKVNP